MSVFWLLAARSPDAADDPVPQGTLALRGHFGDSAVRHTLREVPVDIKDFKDMYLAELQEARSLEEMLIGALPKMAEKAQDSGLKQALQSHLDQTRSHRERLEEILGRHGAAGEHHTDQSMQVLISEAEKMVDMVNDGPVRDAALISSAQRIEHYEIALYGTLASYADSLGLGDDKQVLHDILEQEKTADEMLSELAVGSVNAEAAQRTAA
jgi:ferritin-like metal-binding protein YciE